jgi:hypothetical protein
MRKIVFGLFLLVSCAGTSPTSTTWNGTASDQLVSGAALTDGATVTGLWTMSGTPPSTKMMTKADLVTYTDIPTGNSPLSGYASNQCVSKAAILGVY